jgi:hypothetical protein
MTRLLQYSLLALALALGSSTYAHAETTAVAYNGTLDQVMTFLFGWLIPNNNPSTDKKPVPPKTNVAPEIDPEAAMGAMMLLCGTLTVVRRRRS